MSEDDRVNLAIIVVSYNTHDRLRTCLRSVFASAALSTDWLHVDVIVVDNASRDGSAGMVAAEFPQVHLIASEENLGFTGGNNLALRLLGFTNYELRITHHAPRTTPPDLVLLLNPDTEVMGEALGRMAAVLQDNPNMGACGAHLRYGDGGFQHGAFHFPGLVQVALDLLPLAETPGVRRFLPRLRDSRLNGRYPRGLWQGGAPFPVDFVLGAALMVRAEAIRQVGLLDDGYFMYCEEMDWCLRLWEAGWPVYAVPGARIIHHEGQSSQQVRWEAFERLWRSRFRFHRKHAGRYPPGFQMSLRFLVKVGMALQKGQARRNFAQGAMDGQTLAQALDAFVRVTEHARNAG